MRYLVRHWLSITLFVVTLLPRVVFPEHIALIGDVERDYGYAQRMLRGEGIPLLGIPSSVPRFSQGPLNIWFDALAFLLGGLNLVSPVILSAVLVSVGVVIFFNLLKRYVSTPAALSASLVWVGSLAAISQSRMPFYLFAEPVFLLVFLVFLVKLKHTIGSVLIASLAFFLLFQWELATIPLIGLLLLRIWKLRIHIKTASIGIVAGATLGLLPQIIFDLTHRCQQLCGFGVWMAYRVAATTGFDGRHGYDVNKFGELVGAVNTQLRVLLGLGSWGMLALIVLIGLLSLRLIKNHNPLLVAAWQGTVLLFIGLFIHGQPSEAYFPPFLILLPIIFAFGMNRLKMRWQSIFLLLFLVMVTISTLKLVSSRFDRPAIDKWSVPTSIQINTSL